MGVPAISATKAGEIAEAILIRGDYSELTPEERAKLVVRTCQSLGLNPLTRPIEFINLSGRLTPYVKKDGTDQLRKLYGVSVVELTNSDREDVFIVTAKVRDATGRTDISTGAVRVAGLKGDALANALMKAETKAKRRATLSICGLGFLDETELETIPNAHDAWGEREGQAMANALQAGKAPDLRPVDSGPPKIPSRVQAMLDTYEEKAAACETLTELGELHLDIMNATRRIAQQYRDMLESMIQRHRTRIEDEGDLSEEGNEPRSD